MDKYSILQKTMISLILAGMVFMVVIPLMFFTTISFSNASEVAQFPKKLIPDMNVTVKVEPAEEDEGYEIFFDRGDGYRSVITTDNPTTLQNHFSRQYNITVPGEELLKDFSDTLTEGAKEFTYRKDTFYNFEQFFSIVNNALPALMNSIMVSLLTIVISLTLGSLSGYAMARYEFKFKNEINLGLLIVRMFPIVGITVPMATLLIRFGMFDSILGLAILYSIPNVALTAWITSGIFQGISRELEEASMVFGGTAFNTFVRITLPLAFPALAASSMYAFTTAWNDVLSALILTNTNKTLSLVVYEAIGTTSSGIQYAAAGSIILIIPALVFTFIVRRYINQMWGNTAV